MNSESLRNIWTIAKRELVGYFNSPVAYVFIVIFLLLNGFFTFMLGNYFMRGEANLNAFLMWHPWLYLFLVPAAGMRRRPGTPASLSGKYASACSSGRRPGCSTTSR